MERVEGEWEGKGTREGARLRLGLRLEEGGKWRGGAEGVEGERFERGAE